MPACRATTRPYRRPRRAALCAAHLHTARGIVKSVAISVDAAAARLALGEATNNASSAGRR
eukprot:1403821-Alexandrium_andersonii.AAC.1